MFALAHAGSRGWLHVAVAFFGGGVLTLLYLWRRNLGLNIAAHAIVDLVASLG